MSMRDRYISGNVANVIRECGLPPLNKLPSLCEKVGRGEIYGCMVNVEDVYGKDKPCYIFDLEHSFHSAGRFDGFTKHGKVLIEEAMFYDMFKGKHNSC